MKLKLGRTAVICGIACVVGVACIAVMTLGSRDEKPEGDNIADSQIVIITPAPTSPDPTLAPTSFIDDLTEAVATGTPSPTVVATVAPTVIPATTAPKIKQTPIPTPAVTPQQSVSPTVLPTAMPTITPLATYPSQPWIPPFVYPSQPSVTPTPMPTPTAAPTAAEEYFNKNSEVVKVVAASESTQIPTQTEVTAGLADRGLDTAPITYSYSMDGEYIDETEISDTSAQKSPMYDTSYRSASGELWSIFVIDGKIFANPVSFNLVSDFGVELLVSETDELVSYDSESNRFYVTKPYESAVIIKKVDKIDAATLDSLTVEVLKQR